MVSVPPTWMICLHGPSFKRLLIRGWHHLLPSINFLGALYGLRVWPGYQGRILRTSLETKRWMTRRPPAFSKALRNGHLSEEICRSYVVLEEFDEQEHPASQIDIWWQQLIYGSWYKCSYPWVVQHQFQRFQLFVFGGTLKLYESTSPQIAP